ncbi:MULTISPECIES: NAD(P)H-hydrate dehydratase [unclassified Ligilactobacillus]|uniref:NAD(P)H-hydrate dehydratase n=1 Tax=unclassified Ligilactobacillus TaxID=2767920 RepID=UPI003853FE73
MHQITANVLSRIITPRPRQSHKGTYGRVLLIGGNTTMGGAILMASRAAVNTGAGLVVCATAPANQTALHVAVPEALFTSLSDQHAILAQAKKATVVAVGPGLALTLTNQALLKKLFKTVTVPLIIDAGALTILAAHPAFLATTNAPVIMTPHQMEWQRLSRIPISEQTPAQNWRMRSRLGGTLVLKGAPTMIYHTDNTVGQLTVGTPAMATGGMGDTLTGILAAFCAQFTSPLKDRVEAAVYLHSALATELATTHYVVTPTLLSSQISSFMRRFI